MEAHRAALEELNRERVPPIWALTQDKLGNALRILGEREGGTERLEEAVEAHRAALEEFTRERVPLQWAETQNNLGSALWILGELEGDTELLEEAAVAYRAALEEYTQHPSQLDSARRTQNNLDSVLQRINERLSTPGDAGRVRVRDPSRLGYSLGLLDGVLDFRASVDPAAAIREA